MARILFAALAGLALGAAFILWIGFADFAATDFTAFTPGDVEALGKDFVIKLRARDFQGVVRDMEPNITNVSSEQFEKVAQQFPTGREQRVITTNWQETVMKSVAGNMGPADTVTLGLRYQYADGNAVQVNLVFHRINGKLLVYACNVVGLTAQQTEANQFNLANQNPFSYAYMAIAVLIDAFSIGSFVLCAFGPWPRWRWRWLWMIATLIGVLRINYVFRTGVFYFMPLAFLLPPAQEARFTLDGPWVLSLTIPIGAIGYWLARRRAADARAPAVGGGGMRAG
ncbi:MAG TPA: hypothetical protein VN932_04055 [Rhizomicrobium sp.]|nr:hypothetical protein [Rhizomicrobium sp.]